MMRFFVALLTICAGLGAQGQILKVAPGLVIMSGKTPWALDTWQSALELVPVHRTTIDINTHRGSNTAGELAGSFFYKSKMTTEVPGLTARTRLHSTSPVFYVYVGEETDDSEDPNALKAIWGIVPATIKKDHRIFQKTATTQLTGHSEHKEEIVETSTERVMGVWLRITVTKPLRPGEYALLPMFSKANTFATGLYDFAVDPNSPHSPEAQPAVQPAAEN